MSAFDILGIYECASPGYNNTANTMYEIEQDSFLYVVLLPYMHL